MDTKNLQKIKKGLLKAQQHQESGPSPRVKASIRALIPSNSANISSGKKVRIIPSKILTADGYAGLSKKK